MPQRPSLSVVIPSPARRASPTATASRPTAAQQTAVQLRRLRHACSLPHASAGCAAGAAPSPLRRRLRQLRRQRAETAARPTSPPARIAAPAAWPAACPTPAPAARAARASSPPATPAPSTATATRSNGGLSPRPARTARTAAAARTARARCAWAAPARPPPAATTRRTARRATWTAVAPARPAPGLRSRRAGGLSERRVHRRRLPGPSCADGVKNGAEAGVDCGGFARPAGPDLELRFRGGHRQSGRVPGRGLRGRGLRRRRQERRRDRPRLRRLLRPLRRPPAMRRGRRLREPGVHGRALSDPDGSDGIRTRASGRPTPAAPARAPGAAPVPRTGRRP